MLHKFFCLVDDSMLYILPKIGLSWEQFPYNSIYLGGGRSPCHVRNQIYFIKVLLTPCIVKCKASLVLVRGFWQNHLFSVNQILNSNRWQNFARKLFGGIFQKHQKQWRKSFWVSVEFFYMFFWGNLLEKMTLWKFIKHIQ